MYVWTGCPLYTYGVGCEKVCGFCSGNLSCDVDTGKCDDCQAGYKLDTKLCHTSMLWTNIWIFLAVAIILKCLIKYLV